MKLVKLSLIMLIFVLVGCAAQQTATPIADTARPVLRQEPTLTDQLQDLADQMVASLVSQKKSKIAVVEFTDAGNRVSELGVFLAEEMTTRFFQTGKFEVVERSQLNKVLKEHELSLSGLMDESTAKKLGELLGADALAIGTISDLRDVARVNSRLISTETGTVFAAAAVSLTLDSRVRDMMSRYPTTSSPLGKVQPQTAQTQAAKGAEKVILSGSRNNVFKWAEGAPYTTTLQVYDEDIAFISTGNNYFYQPLGKVGYEKGEYRYISFWIYLLKPQAGLLLQMNIGGNWEHRWRIDGRASYQGGWPWDAKGQSLNIATGQWVEISLDLIDDMGAKPGQDIGGLAFSGGDGNLIYDLVTLIGNQ